MAKSQVNARVPGDLEGELDQYADQRDISDAEAARQLLRRGVEEWRDDGEHQQREPPGETLTRQATTISVVLAVAGGAMLALPGGPTWALGASLSGVASTLLFGVLWLSVRVLAGRADFGASVSRGQATGAGGMLVMPVIVIMAASAALGISKNISGVPFVAEVIIFAFCLTTTIIGTSWGAQLLAGWWRDRRGETA